MTDVLVVCEEVEDDGFRVTGITPRTSLARQAFAKGYNPAQFPTIFMAACNIPEGLKTVWAVHKLDGTVVLERDSLK